MDSQIPAPEHLRNDPELAALGVLCVAIDAAIGALQAAYPELYLDDDDWDLPLVDPALLATAERIINYAEELGGSVSWYWSETVPKKPPPSPFEH